MARARGPPRRSSKTAPPSANTDCKNETLLLLQVRAARPPHRHLAVGQQRLHELTGLGMTPDTVKPGDVVTVSYHPLKDGSRGGQFMQALLPNGKMAVRRPGGPNLQQE